MQPARHQHPRRERDGRGPASLARAEAAGAEAIVLTVDAPGWGNRERDARNGFRLPSGMTVANVGSGAEAIEAVRNDPPDVVVSDLMMPEMDGIALLRSAIEIEPDLVGIIMTGEGTIATAVDAHDELAVLVDWLHVAEVWVGANFLFGHERAGTFSVLRALGMRHGFRAEKIDPVRKISTESPKPSWNASRTHFWFSRVWVRNTGPWSSSPLVKSYTSRRQCSSTPAARSARSAGRRPRPRDPRRSGARRIAAGPAAADPGARGPAHGPAAPPPAAADVRCRVKSPTPTGDSSCKIGNSV